LAKEIHLAQAGLTDLPLGWEIIEVSDLLLKDRGIAVGVMYPGDHDPFGIPLIRVGDMSGSLINPRPEFRVSPVASFDVMDRLLWHQGGKYQYCPRVP